MILWVLMLLLCSGSAWAGGQMRYAIVVGADRGAADEVILRYAERDAARVAEVLSRFGEVPEEHLILLRGRSAEDLERVLSNLKQRIAQDEAAGLETLLFFFYSGHADADALHLGSSELPLRRLKALVDDSQARLRVMVVDACRSGELTRVKGARPVAAFEIDADDQLASEGSAIITSSAAGEDAQESDRIKGGIFSHHFVLGLLGAADSSGDQRITLNEAYRYAYEQTLRSTSRARVVQHPSYSFRMRGRDDLILTRLTETRGLGRLALEAPGRYLLLPRSGKGRVVDLSAQATTEVLLEPGDWLVRRRSKEAVYEGQARINAGERTRLAKETLQRMPYGRTVRRGDALSQRSAWRLSAGAGLTGPHQVGFGPSYLGQIGAQIDLVPLSLAFRLRWSWASSMNEDLLINQHSLGFDAGALKLYDLNSQLALGFGLHLGADGLFQNFETQGQSPDREALMGRMSPALRVEYAPLAWLTLSLEAGIDALLMRVQDEPGIQLKAVPISCLNLEGYMP